MTIRSARSRGVRERRTFIDDKKSLGAAADLAAALLGVAGFELFRIGYGVRRRIEGRDLERFYFDCIFSRADAASSVLLPANLASELGAVGGSGRLNAAELSGKALAVLRRILAGETVTQADSGLSPREWRELQAHLQRD